MTRAQPIVCPDCVGEINHAFGMTRRFVVTAAQSDGAVSVWVEDIAPQTGPPRHRHGCEQELCQVVTGRILFVCDGNRIEVDAGGFVLIPAGADHSFRNIGKAAARIVITLMPGGIEGFFREVETQALALPADMAALDVIAARYNLTFTGPPIEA